MDIGKQAIKYEATKIALGVYKFWCLDTNYWSHLAAILVTSANIGFVYRNGRRYI